VSENWRQFDAGTVINDKSQGSVATRSMCSWSKLPCGSHEKDSCS